jgi:PAS domain S-box-containing protein
MPENQKFVREKFLAGFQEGVIEPIYENSILTKNAVERIIRFSNIVLHDSQGEVIGATSIGEDITNRRLAENALKESEKEFRLLAESMPQIVWATRADGWNIYFNQQWVDYTGMTLEESYGFGWNIPFHPDDQQDALDAWNNATKNNGSYSIEARLRRFDGEYHWWLVRGVPQVDEKGEITKWFGTCTDIEDIKKAEKTLRESEQLYRDLFENTQAVMLLLDPENGKIVDANPAASRFYGWSNAELVGMNIGKINAIQDDELRKLFKHASDQKQNHFFFNHILADRTIRNVEVYTSQIVIDAKKILYSIVHDITELKNVQRALSLSELKFRLVFKTSPDSININRL